MPYVVTRNGNASTVLIEQVYSFETLEEARESARERAEVDISAWFVFYVEQPVLMTSFKSVSKVEEIDLSKG